MSDLDERLSEGRAAVATMDPPADLWARVAERSNDRDATMLDPAVARHRRRPPLWLAVAAAVALIALVGTLALRHDGQRIETVPAGPGTASTTPDEPRMIVLVVPFTVDLPDGWTIVEDNPFHQLTIGPASGLPQSRIDFAVPEEATTVEEGIAYLAALAPSPFVLGDPIDTTVGRASATCMDIEAADRSRTPLLHFRPNPPEQPPDDREVALDEGAVGRVCVVDARGHQGETPVVVLIQAPADEFPAFLAEAEAVLADLEFENRGPDR